jgi:hypothetical protein
MTEYTWALVAALIATTVGVSLVAIRQTKRLVALKKEKAHSDALARLAEKELALAKHREAAKKALNDTKQKPKQAPLLGVVEPKKKGTK